MMQNFIQIEEGRVFPIYHLAWNCSVWHIPTLWKCSSTLYLPSPCHSPPAVSCIMLLLLAEYKRCIAWTYTRITKCCRMSGNVLRGKIKNTTWYQITLMLITAINGLYTSDIILFYFWCRGQAVMGLLTLGTRKVDTHGGLTGLWTIFCRSVGGCWMNFTGLQYCTVQYNR